MNVIGTISLNHFSTLQPTGQSAFIESRKEMTYPIVFYKTKESIEDPLYWEAEDREFFLLKVEKLLNADFFWYNKEACFYRGCLYPNFFRDGPIWDSLPPYHIDRIPVNGVQVKRPRLGLSLYSDDGDEEEPHAASGLGNRVPAVLPCFVKETKEKTVDNLSDDEFQVSSCAIGGRAARKRAPERPTAVASVDIDATCIWRNMVPLGTPQIEEDSRFDKRICRPHRSLPVFVGLLSLAAAPSCRILSPTDLEHARFIVLTKLFFIVLLILLLLLLGINRLNGFQERRNNSVIMLLTTTQKRCGILVRPRPA